jgi:hypothetical protein
LRIRFDPSVPAVALRLARAQRRLADIRIARFHQHGVHKVEQQEWPSSPALLEPSRGLI